MFLQGPMGCQDQGQGFRIRIGTQMEAEQQEFTGGGGGWPGEEFRSEKLRANIFVCNLPPRF